MPATSFGNRMFLLRRYFDRQELEASFAKGIIRDLPRHAIPTGGQYDLLDYLVDRPGMLYKRGGTSYQSEALAGESDIIAVAAPEYPGDPRVIAVTSNGPDRTLYDITLDTAAAGIDLNGAQPGENPPLYVDRLIITDAVSATAYQVQKVYLDSGVVTVADLGGSPPVARYSCVHAGRLVLANSDDFPNRIWFSDPIDAENAWDTDLATGAWIPADEPVTGLASVQGVLLVFSRGGYQRVLGDIPPGYGTAKSAINMSIQPGAQVGCIDARSIAYFDNEVLVANETGVFALTGAGGRSLTLDGGIAALWQDTIQGFSPALGAVVAAGVFKDHLFISVTRRPGDDFAGQRDTFLCYLPTGAWTRLTGGCGAFMYATRFAPSTEMFFGQSVEAATNRALKMSGIFIPSAGNKQDADGTDIEPAWITRALGMGSGVGPKHFDDGHLTYRLEDAATDAPTLAVTETEGLEADGSPIAVSTLAAVTGIARRRLTLARETQGLTVTVAQAGPSARTEIHLLELMVRTLDPGDGAG